MKASGRADAGTGRHTKERKRKKPRSFAAFVLNFGSQMPNLFAIMLVSVDFLAGLVLLFVELLLLALGQMTVVGRHIGLFLVLDVLFLVFHVCSLSRRHGAVPLAVGDTVLLILLAGIDFVNAGMIGIDYSWSRAGCVAVLGLSSGGANRDQTTHCQD
jgi:hypothetical protein